MQLAIDELKKRLEGVDCDVIAGTESRGFIFGMPLAYLLKKPFILVRKAGKLPCETVSKTYDLHAKPIWKNNIETEHEKMFEEQGIKTKALIAKLK